MNMKYGIILYFISIDWTFKMDMWESKWEVAKENNTFESYCKGY